LASIELINQLKSNDSYLKRKGIHQIVVDGEAERVSNAYVSSVRRGISDKDIPFSLKLSSRVKKIIDSLIFEITGFHIPAMEYYCFENDIEFQLLNDYYEILLLESPYLVDSFFRYIELDTKDPYKRFYFPRQIVLKPVVSAYQEIYDGKLDFLSVSQPKRTGKTTSGLKLAQMMGGRDPDGSIFGVGKGEGLVKRFYGGLLQDFETEKTYKRFLNVFPEATKIGEKDYKSAENLSIDLKSKNIFPTFTCRPIDGAIVGCTEANVLVYIDDCVKNHEEARNRDRLEFLCEKVTDDVLGRRLEGTPIIIQGTKYSLYDPITALQNKADELEWRWKEVAIPALDPITDESNWEIYRKDKKGLRKIFTTVYYQKERKLVSEETWAAEFQQEPFEAKGRMFAENELNYFEELPVDREPDAIMAACDSADKGEDSCSMPIGYVYGNEVYIVDVVFDNAGTQFTKPECANMLIKHNVKTVTFESNSAGEYFGRDVMDIVKKQGGRCSARFKFNCSNKITRMENARDNIIRDYYFRDFKKMDRQSQYYKFMKELTTMTRSGKVKHDDAPDSVALFENEMRSGTQAKVEAAVNPFRRY
jgi:predicted phage terminase large subunit-like protein